MRNISYYYGSILAFLFGLFAAFYFSGCFKKMNTVTVTHTKVDTVYVKRDTTIYKKGKDIVISNYIHDTINRTKIDTLKVLGDYFSKVVYLDTFSVGDGYIALRDTISENRIQARIFNLQLKEKVITIHESEKPKTELYWGVGGTFLPNVSDIYVNGMVRTKSKRLYGIGVGLNGNNQVVYKLNVLIKL